MTANNNSTVVQSTDEGKPLHAGQSTTDPAAMWNEARIVYPLYATAATQFDLLPAPYPADELPPDEPRSEVFDRVTRWLDEMDQKLLAFQFRQLPPEVLNAS